MKQISFTENLAWILKVSDHEVDRQQLAAFVASAWVWIQEDADTFRWAREFIDAMAAR